MVKSSSEKSSERMPKKASKKPIFAEGICFKKLFFVFIIGSIFGDYYERLLNLVTYSWGGTPWFWERRSAVIYGPFSIIYGFGAVLIIVALIWLPNKILQKHQAKSLTNKAKASLTNKATASLANETQDQTTSTIVTDTTPLTWWQLFLGGGILCGIAEYIFGVFQEIFTGTVSWNYSDHFLNINGRTSPYVMCIWGLICLIFVKYAYPPLSRLIEKIPLKIGNVIFWVFLIFLTFDMLISFSAVLKMNLRRHNIPTFTPYGEFLDSTYPDKRIRTAYPNMVEV